jgi:hypothetical protein
MGHGRDGTRDEVIAKYRTWIMQQPSLMAALHELRGKHLVCWCAPERCHAEVLLELARYGGDIGRSGRGSNYPLTGA